jgi:pSer/pThr/pTyr-binding forkhead associated (FHA) protein
VPTLVIVDPQGGEQELELQGGEYTLGRERSAEVHLDSPKVSRKHARLFREGGRFFIEDLNSANGVFVGGERIDGPVALTASIEVDVGDFRLWIVDEAAAEGFALQGETPPCAGERYALAPGEHDVGRVSDCTIVINDASVSRRHAKLTVSASGISVEDLGSSNGTFVGGSRIERRDLRSGERVRFGNIEFTVHGGSPQLWVLPWKKLAIPGAAVVTVLVVGMAVALAFRSSGKSNAGVFATYDAMLAAENERAELLMRSESWAAAAQKFSEVLDKDPINKDARAGLQVADQNLKHQEAVAMARRDLERDAPAEAVHRLAEIGQDSHYGKAAALVAREARAALAQQAMTAARTACARNDYLECHKRAVMALENDQAIAGARDLITLSEAALRTRKITFTPWSGPR